MLNRYEPILLTTFSVEPNAKFNGNSFDYDRRGTMRIDTQHEFFILLSFFALNAENT
jgi:hypothetical protein